MKAPAGTREAQETTRTCTTGGATETPEQDMSNPRRHRAAHRVNTRHLPDKKKKFSKSLL
jgi:hypothetical protein